jgi:hypothetical protein
MYQSTQRPRVKVYISGTCVISSFAAQEEMKASRKRAVQDVKGMWGL